MKQLSGLLIIFYQRLRQAFAPALISILPPRACRFSPTCSVYTKEAINKYGILKGVFLGGARVLKCHPFTKPKYDPVP